MIKTLGEQIREDRIDRGAAALRLHQMGHRCVGMRDWSDIPNSAKKKWIEAARVVFDAAFQDQEIEDCA